MLFGALALLHALAGAPVAFAAEVTYPARMDIEKPMEGLEWDATQLQAKIQRTEIGIRATTRIRGYFKRQYWTLLVNRVPIKVTDKGHFEIEYPLHAKQTVLKMYAVSPLGQVEIQNLTITFESWDYLKSTVPKQFFITPSIGLTFLNYTEAGVNRFSAPAITLRGAARQNLWNARWSAQVNFYYTLLPLGSNSDGDSARYFGFNLRVGYVTPLLTYPWTLTVAGGVYYTRMFVTNDDFGYADVAGPQVYPVLRYSFSSGSELIGYFKLSPVTDGISLLQLSNRELALGAAYVPNGRSEHPISYLVDYADLSATFQGVDIDSKSLSFSIAIGL